MAYKSNQFQQQCLSIRALAPVQAAKTAESIRNIADGLSRPFDKIYIVGNGDSLVAADNACYFFRHKFDNAGVAVKAVRCLDSAKYDVSYNPRDTKDITLIKYPAYEIRTIQGEWKYELYADAPGVPAYYRGTANRSFSSDGYDVYLINDIFMLQDRFEYDGGGSTHFTDRVYYIKY